MKNELSVIILIYNEEKTIMEILDRIKELIVINNGSNDNNYKILGEIKNIKLINHKNVGKSVTARIRKKV